MEGVWSERFAREQRFRKLNPLNWPIRTVKIFLATFFLILLPIYLYIGFLPAASIEAIDYPILEIPSLNLSSPVAPIELQGRELIAPAQIAGLYQPSENKLFIIGHSTTVFKDLNQLILGRTFNYDHETYIIQDIQTLAKADIDMSAILAPALEKTIIIMTCAGELLDHHDATHRLIITATLADSVL